MARDNDTARIFISYARSDGKDFARQLRDRLEKEGLKVWQDLAAMEGGKDWWRQIASTIQHKDLEYLVLVMTPRGLASPIVRKEWRLARQEGKCVVPVIGSRDLDVDGMPGWMKAAHFVHLEDPEQWTRMLRTLEGPCQQSRVPFMVEELPPDFVPRPGEFEDLVGKLSDRDSDSTVAITAALRGAGGYGKTTLARALCHDERIQDTYHDGVLWVTLGETPGDLNGRIQDLIYVLRNERPGFSSIEAASNGLAESLADRAILLVVDDVWKAGHARPFLRGGEQCAYLLTTRDAATLPTDARRVPVDQMRASEAVTLLGSGVECADKRALAELASRLGEWPLLLKLVNARLQERARQGQSTEAAIDYVNRALDKRGLVAFDARNPDERHQAAASTLGVSLDVLDDAERARLTELAVFPEDMEVPLETVELLWGATAGLDDLETEELAERLFGLSLLQSLDLTTGRLRIHDVVHTYLEQQLGKVGLRGLHSRFLDAWGLHDWSALSPNEPYLWHHLVWHLRKAGRLGNQRALLLDHRWLQAKLDATDITALLADYACAPDDPAIQTVEGALRLSAHVVAGDPTQLAGQLLGRLSKPTTPDLQALKNQIEDWAETPWLRPATAVLAVPGGPLVLTLTGHEGKIRAVAAAPDGLSALSGSDDHTVRVWDLKRGVAIRTLRGHTDWIRAVAFMPDATHAVSAADDHSVRLWNLATGICERTIDMLPQWPRSLAVTADGTLIAVGTADGPIRLWSAVTGEPTGTLTRHSATVNALAVGPSGKQLFSGSDDRRILAWDLDLTGEHRVIGGHKAKVMGLALIGNDRLLSAAADDTLMLWDLGAAPPNNGQIVTSAAYRARALAVTADGRRAITASEDYNLSMWDLSTGELQETMAGHSDWVVSVAVSAVGGRIISGSYDGTLKVWELLTSNHNRPSPAHTDRVRVIALSPGAERAFTSSDDNTLRVWNTETGDLERTFRRHNHWPFTLTPDGQHALSAASNGTLKLWNLSSGLEERRFAGHRERIRAAAVFPDGTRVVSAADDRTIRVWNLSTGEEELTVNIRYYWLRGLAVTRDGCFVITASEGRALKMWDLSDGSEARTLRGHAARINAVAVSLDGQHCFSASDDHTVRMWHLEGGREVRVFTGHTARVQAVVTTSHGRHVVSASDDYTLRVWDVEDGRQVAVFTGESPMVACAANPKEPNIVAGDQSGRIHFLRLQGVA